MPDHILAPEDGREGCSAQYRQLQVPDWVGNAFCQLSSAESIWVQTNSEDPLLSIWLTLGGQISWRFVYLCFLIPHTVTLWCHTRMMQIRINLNVGVYWADRRIVGQKWDHEARSAWRSQQQILNSICPRPPFPTGDCHRWFHPSKAFNIPVYMIRYDKRFFGSLWHTEPESCDIPKPHGSKNRTDPRLSVFERMALLVSVDLSSSRAKLCGSVWCCAPWAKSRARRDFPWSKSGMRGTSLGVDGEWRTGLRAGRCSKNESFLGHV